MLPGLNTFLLKLKNFNKPQFIFIHLLWNFYFLFLNKFLMKALFINSLIAPKIFVLILFSSS